jgi:hypothetical protein
MERVPENLDANTELTNTTTNARERIWKDGDKELLLRILRETLL